jgi:hypothetical protein
MRRRQGMTARTTRIIRGMAYNKRNFQYKKDDPKFSLETQRLTTKIIMYKKFPKDISADKKWTG